MTINKQNYEAFFLDYHEGNLTPQQVAELLLFVEQHPEFREEFESFENISLADLPSVSFDFKANLKKEITVENKDDYFIRAVENTITPAEQILLDTFLKQHPHFLSDLGLFKKTKLQADLSIVFENKEQLKDLAISNDHILIASVEGLLSAQEITMLNQQLAVDAQMKQDHYLYRQTKLSADTAVVFEDKEELKRKESRAVPFYYFVAAAASILLVFGIFTLSNTGTGTQTPEFAKHDKTIKTQPLQNTDPANEQATAVKENASAPENPTAAVLKPDRVKTKITLSSNKAGNDSVQTNPNPVINTNELENKNLANNTVPEKQELPVTNEQPVVAQNNPEKTQGQAPAVKEEFLSLAQMATRKIKEKTLDPESLASEKKTGKLKKISGWDVLQVLAKGASKVTGKNVEVKPTYNEEGDVTAYAFNAGKLGFSKGR